MGTTFLYVLLRLYTHIEFELIHLALNKFSTLQTTFSNVFSWMKLFVLYSNVTEFVSKGPIDNKSVLVQVMV